MEKIELKFMFDWGSGVCLWSLNDEAYNRYGTYPVETDKLPISKTLKDKMEALISKHDEALDWSYPPGPLLWNDDEVNAFLKDAENIYHELCAELGSDYKIELHGGM